MVVVDYSDNQIKILEVTQKSLQKSLSSLVGMRGWGNPVNKYDILVKKEGYKKTTEYFLSPIPPSPLDPAIEEKWKNTEINLEALFY